VGFSFGPTVGAKMFLQDLNPAEHFLLLQFSRLSGLSVRLLSVGSPFGLDTMGGVLAKTLQRSSQTES